MTQRIMASYSNGISFLFLTCLIGFCQAGCFSQRCDTPGQFFDCIQGEWTCDPEKFCEVTTHDQHGHGQGSVTMNCRDIESLADCFARSRRNSPMCDVHTNLETCHWCCKDRECMLLLEWDIFPVEETTAAATTNTDATTQAPTTTPETTTSKTLSPETKPPETTLVSMETTTIPTITETTPSPVSSSEATHTDTAPVTTTATVEKTIGANCQDMYLGDCERDFGDQCDDKNIRIMCPLTCKACP